MSISTTFPFTTPGDFTYDTTKVEITGGKAKLLDLTPSNATCGATFTSNINLNNWSAGTVTGTATGGATVSSGKLNLIFDDVRYVSYDADLNADSQQTGCIRFKLTPNYSGTPSTQKTFFGISQAFSNLNNLIQLNQLITTGNLAVAFYDSTGVAMSSADLGNWSPTSGTEYEFELNYDFTSGATRLFIDGTQKGSTITSTGTRSSSIADLRIGTNYVGS